VLVEAIDILTLLFLTREGLTCFWKQIFVLKCACICVCSCFDYSNGLAVSISAHKGNSLKTDYFGSDLVCAIVRECSRIGRKHTEGLEIGPIPVLSVYVRFV
jgi:hypothetical protein